MSTSDGTLCWCPLSFSGSHLHYLSSSLNKQYLDAEEPTASSRPEALIDTFSQWNNADIPLELRCSGSLQVAPGDDEVFRRYKLNMG